MTAVINIQLSKHQDFIRGHKKLTSMLLGLLSQFHLKFCRFLPKECHEYLLWGPVYTGDREYSRSIIMQKPFIVEPN